MKIGAESYSFVIRRDNSDDAAPYFFELMGSSGPMMSSSAHYKTYSAADNAIVSVSRAFSMAENKLVINAA